MVVTPQQTEPLPQTGHADGPEAANGAVATVKGVAGETEPRLGKGQIQQAGLMALRAGNPVRRRAMLGTLGRRTEWIR